MPAKSYCPVANVWCFWWKVLESNVTLLTGTVICITFYDKSLSPHLVWSSVIKCHLQIYGWGDGMVLISAISYRWIAGISSDSSYCWCVGGTLLIDGFHGSIIKLQSQNSEVLRILIYTRLKINKKINLWTSLLPRSLFPFENRAIWTSSFSQCVTPILNRIAVALRKSLFSCFSLVNREATGS